MNDPTSPLSKYYAANPREDGIDADGNPVHDPTTPIVGHSWQSAITANAVNVPDGKTKFPWIIVNMDKFNGVVNIDFNGTHVFGPWNLAGRDKMWAIISVPASDDCNMVEYALDKGTGHADKVLDNSLFDVFLDSDKFTTETAMDNPVSVKNSVFTDNGGALDYAIYNAGKLSLEKNTISNLVYSEGELDSNVNITVMDNNTYNFSYKAINITATATDDNGNAIVISDINFIVGTVEIPTVYDYETNLYVAEYTPTSEGEFVVTMNTTLPVNTAVITFTKSLSDIAKMVAEANPGDVIELNDNYRYVEELDSAYVEGIVIDKVLTIDGKGYTISGSNAARIFKVTNGTFTLKNITISDALADQGAGIYVVATTDDISLVVKDATFTNNFVTDGGAAIAIIGDGKVATYDISDSTFDKNTMNNATSPYLLITLLPVMVLLMVVLLS